jgi:hypothetical protein
MRVWRVYASSVASGDQSGWAIAVERLCAAAGEVDQDERRVVQAVEPDAARGQREPRAVGCHVELRLAVLAVGVRREVAALAALAVVGDEVRRGLRQPVVPVAHGHLRVVQRRGSVLLPVGRSRALLAVGDARQHVALHDQGVGVAGELEGAHAERLVRERARLPSACRQQPDLRALLVVVVALGRGPGRPAVRQEAERAVPAEARRAVVRRPIRERDRRRVPGQRSDLDAPQIVHVLCAVGVEACDRDRRPGAVRRHGERSDAPQPDEPLGIQRGGAHGSLVLTR